MTHSTLWEAKLPHFGRRTSALSEIGLGRDRDYRLARISDTDPVQTGGARSAGVPSPEETAGTVGEKPGILVYLTAFPAPRKYSTVWLKPSSIAILGVQPRSRVALLLSRLIL